MNTEFETKVLDIDVNHIKQRLKELWATFVWEKKFRRYVYDMHPPMNEKWIRLRTDWMHTTLTCKHIIDSHAIDGVKEREIIVDSFDVTNDLLEQMWYIAKAYQENNRESYTLDDCEIEIDSRPMIPSYLEIESSNKESVLKMLEKLWVTGLTTTSENTTDIYKRYWIENLSDYTYISFQEVRRKWD